MKTDELLAMKLELNERSTRSSQALTDYCKPFKGAMGLTSDECRQSEQYKQLKRQFDTDWLNLRAFNKMHSKNKDLQKAIRDDIHARRIAKASLVI